MLWSKERLHRKKPASTCLISLQEWQFLSDLLKSGYPLLDALTFLHKREDSLKDRLEEGEPLLDILTENKKGRFYDHLRFFMKITSLADAIQCSLHMLTFEKGLHKKLLVKAAYPIFIFVFAYVMLLVFTTMIIPQMLTSFQADTGFTSLIVMVTVIKTLCGLFAIIVLLALLGIWYLHGHDAARIRFLRKGAVHVHMIPDYISYMFSGYLLELEMQGISTRHAMQYLKEVRANTLFSYFIKDVSASLEEGVALLDIMETHILLNEGFRLSFRIGASTANLTQLLTAFMKQQEHMWDHTIQRISIVLQCVAYGFVGIVVLIVYQIMMVPLTMLETM